MAKLVLTDITGSYASVAALNANFALTETALENTLSRDGTTPNTMLADIDLNNNDLLNVRNIEAQFFKDENGVVVAFADYTGTVASETFSGNGSTLSFAVTVTPVASSNLSVFIDGVYQQKATYTVSGTNIIFSEAPPLGTNNIEIIVISSLPIGSTTADLVGYTPAGTGAVATTVQDKLRESVSVKDFGAVGDGVTDDTAAIQAAIDGVFARGGGEVYVDSTTTYYKTTFPLYMRKGVSVVGHASRPKIWNLYDAPYNFFYHQVFACGNFHPAYLQTAGSVPDGSPPFPRDAIAVTTPGTFQVTLSVGGTGASYSVGEQIVVVSTTQSSAAGYDIPTYMFLNEVVAIAGDVLSLRYPIDVALTGGVAKLSGRFGRNSAPLFFWQNGSLRNLEIETIGYWMADSATLNCNFENLTITSRTMVYGNAFQYTNWRNLDCRFSWKVSECSMNSFYNNVTGFRALFTGTAPFDVANEGITIQENARYVQFSNGTINTGANTNGSQALRILNASNVQFHDISVDCPATRSGALIYVGGSIDPNEIDCADNKIKDIAINARGGAGSFLYVEDVLVNGKVHDNIFDNITGRGVCTSAVAFVSTTVQNILRNSNFDDGNLLLASSPVNQIIENCFFEDGVNGETGSSDLLFQVNTLRGNSSAAWAAKRTSLRSLAGSLITSGTANLSIISAALGTNAKPRDRWDVLVRGSINGTNAAKRLQIVMVNNTDVTETVLATINILAAVQTTYVLQATVLFNTSSLLVHDVRFIPPTVFAIAPTYISGATTVALSGKDLTFVVRASVDNAADSVTANMANCSIYNPFYAG
jgi:hypothetical protein